MAQKSGGGLSWWRQALVNMGLRAAAYGAGSSFSLKDPQIASYFGGGPTYSGKDVTDRSAMRVSTWWSCARILAESVATLPRAMFKKLKSGNSEQADHPLGDVLIHSPNQDMDDVEYFEAGVVNLVGRGNAYSLKEMRGNGSVSALYPIPSYNVQPKRETDGTVVYRILDRGKWDTYPREKIWHVKGFGDDGLIGFSPIALARETLGQALATEEFAGRTFSQGVWPSMIATREGFLTEDQRKIWKEKIADKYGGLENVAKLMLLEGGVKVEQAKMVPLEDLQFIEVRRFQSEDICRIHRIPPHMVANMERATFSNIEQMSQEFVTYTLLPWLVRFERSVSRWLLKPSERGEWFLRFNYEGLLRADSEGRSKFLTSMLQNGVMSRNEARAKENLNRVDADGMDDYTVQSNMALIDQIAALITAQTVGQVPAAQTPAALNVINTLAPAQFAEASETAVAKTQKQVAEAIEATGQVNKTVAGALKDIGQSQSSIATAVTALAGETVALAKSMDSMNRRLTDSMRELAEKADRPRKLVLDAAGDPIGNIAVDSLN